MKNIVEKPFQIHYRVTKHEYEIVKAKAKKAGLSISEYCRRATTGKDVFEAPPPAFSDFILEIKRIGSNLSQLIRKLDTTGSIHTLELERCTTDIQKTMNALYQSYLPKKGNR